MTGDAAQYRQGQVALIGDSDSSDRGLEAAQTIGAMVAGLGLTLITGGGGGVMEAACRGARQAGGLTVGILPSDSLEDANPYCQVVLPTGMGHARNALTVLGADLVIAIGGGAGTMSELCFAWISGKPILGLQGLGGWVDRLAQDPTLDRRSRPPIVICRDLDGLRVQIIGVCTELAIAVKID